MTDCAALENEIAIGQNNFEDTGDRKWNGHYFAADQRFDELECESS